MKQDPFDPHANVCHTRVRKPPDFWVVPNPFWKFLSQSFFGGKKDIQFLLLKKNIHHIMLRTSLRIATRSQSTVAKTAPRALSNAYLGNLESRWTTLPKEDQTALIEELKTRMELPWQNLTTAEKKAAYYISFGEWAQESHCTTQVTSLRSSGVLPVPLLHQSLSSQVSDLWASLLHKP